MSAGDVIEPEAWRVAGAAPTATTFDLSAVPQDLKNAQRWLVWKLNERGRKPPVDAEGRALDDWNGAAAWLSYDDAVTRVSRLREAQPGEVLGVGFVLGAGWAGVDLDDCVNAEGRIDPRAEIILELMAGAYAEFSPSGLGVKAFGRGDGWVEIKFGKEAPRAQAKRTGYFTVTGDALPGRASLPDLPLSTLTSYFGGEKAERVKAGVLPKDGAPVPPGMQDDTLTREARALRGRGYDEDAIAAALWGLVESGKFPAAPGRAPWTRTDCRDKARRVSQKFEAGKAALAKDQNGKPFATPDNVRLAFRILGARPRRNRFARRDVLERDGERRHLDDELMRRLWFELDESLHLKVAKALFHDVAHDEAAKDDFHPVREYLDALEWDRKPRVDTWLIGYGGARDSAYVRAVGRLFLVAAVRRVRQPGVKFDELLVLESETQGLDKSKALRALCPNPDWFSENLPLGADSKVVIERTTGVWIAEAAEMVGNRSDVDKLKAFLSTQVDGPARLAYEREPVIVPRQFVTAGTTNRGAYLRDSSGGRRFWPVDVGRMKADAIERDRDQLWAEAVHLEASNASIRLAEKLWRDAGEEQEARRVVDPWEDVIAERLGSKDGKVTASSVWSVVGVETGRRTQEENGRMGAVMRRLGFKSTTVKNNRGRQWRGYVRGDVPPGGERSWLLSPELDPSLQNRGEGE